MLINPSREVVFSLFSDSYSKSVRLGGFKSVENNYLNGDVTPRIFLKLSELITSASGYIFLFTNFFFIISIYTWCMKEKKCTPLRSYIFRAVNVGAEFNVYGYVSFVLYTIDVELCATWHESSDNTENIILFREKIQNFVKCKYTGGQIQ